MSFCCLLTYLALSSHPPLLPFSFYTKYNRKSQQWQSTRQYYRCEIYHLASWKVLYEPYLPRRRLFIMNRSEEHTSELQSRFDLVCRLLLEKKKNIKNKEQHIKKKKKKQHQVKKTIKK